jgi:hypothetical protein
LKKHPVQNLNADILLNNISAFAFNP